ncbi:M1 family metallopeptidase [Crassaminicella indica]|uniref:M1 family metallopeptidase n=1 Tax=Crassaminicella indica TaxID=2855394 RepID=A0ABX8RDD9_9CLOT|nr:M1 family metallopeptidase [Crassaminicella indica]QXM07099.1 M1 family metallopeptidase [Crassaminicella indica]
MKKIGIILLAILFLLTGCKEKEVEKITHPTLIVNDYNGVNPENIDQYDIELAFSPKDHIIKGKQRVDYINKENASLKEVYFHLYPNSFRKKETAPFLMNDFDRAYPDGFEAGYINIEKVSIGNKPVAFTLEGEGQTIMKVVLPKSINSNERISIDMQYTIKIPPAKERFGYSEDIFNLGNWYPIAAVYDETGWNLDPYYPLGDPFYSDVSNYHVRIETPKDFIVAASGNILKDTIVGDKRVWEIEAKLMRDFAFVTSNRFEVVEKDVEGTTLKMYFMKDVKQGIADKAIESAENALKTFNRVYGKYPYGQYSVVQTNFPSGMEYPGIVFIGKDYYNDYGDFLGIVIVHETGHQWWYGVVGNDEIDEAWLDESLTTYSEVVYTREMFGEETGKEYYQYMNEEPYKSASSSISNETILRPLNKFEGWDDYGILVYNKGAMLLNTLYETYGKEKFYEIMKQYYQTYQFKNAKTEDFKRVCEEVVGENLDELFNKWLLGE